jgi:hypothetical protein
VLFTGLLLLAPRAVNDLSNKPLESLLLLLLLFPLVVLLLLLLLAPLALALLAKSGNTLLSK